MNLSTHFDKKMLTMNAELPPKYGVLAICAGAPNNGSPSVSDSAAPVTDLTGAVL